MVCVLAGIVIELLLYIFRPANFSKKLILACSLMLSTFGASALLVSKPNLFSGLIVYLTIYRLINIIKIAENKIKPEYLHSTSFRTYRWLALMQTIIIALWLLNDMGSLNVNNIWLLASISVAFVITSLAIAISSVINIRNSGIKFKNRKKDQELPTLTLAIAARNENLMLENCLDCALANSYPKLEIIVYDDCSQDRTADIIKAYAQKGIRFIQGGSVPEKWLAKNWAYQQLFEQSSGDLIMFMGVDVLINPDTLNKVVGIFIKRKVSMMSVMPKRVKSGLIAAFIQPMRYWWEFAIPSYILKRPPVLSTCWLINHDVLSKSGGFKSITRAIIPEEHLAKQQAKIHEYAFIRGNASLGLSTVKNFYSQWSTAIRTRYPQVHRRPELVALRTLLMTLCLLLPFVILAILFRDMSDHVLIFICSIISVVLLTATNVSISLISNPVATMMSIINFPVLIALDIFALNYSMYKYEFSEVTWKGRDVSQTAMHSIKHLPKI